MPRRNATKPSPWAPLFALARAGIHKLGVLVEAFNALVGCVDSARPLRRRNWSNLLANAAVAVGAIFGCQMSTVLHGTIIRLVYNNTQMVQVY